MSGQLPPYAQVCSIQSGLPTAEYIRQRSVLECKTIADLTSHLLGAKTWTSTCGTCDEPMSGCPGHEGHIELPVPCFHVGSIPTLVSILNLVCFYCQRLRLPRGDMRYQQVLKLPLEKRLESLHRYSRNFTFCGKTDEKNEVQPDPQEEEEPEQEEIEDDDNWTERILEQLYDSENTPPRNAPEEEKFHDSKTFSSLSCKQILEQHDGCGMKFIRWETEAGHDNIIRGVVNLQHDDKIRYQQDPTWKPIRFGPTEIMQVLQIISDDKDMMEVMGFGPSNLPKSRMIEALVVPALNTRPMNIYSTPSGTKQYINDWTKMLRNVMQSKLLLEIKRKSNKEPIYLSQYQYVGFTHPDFRVCFKYSELETEQRKQLNKAQKQAYRAELAQLNTIMSKCKINNESTYENISVQCAWRNVQNQISAFHFEKYRKLIPKNSQYGKTPTSVDSRYKGKSKKKHSSRFRGFVIAWKKYYYARMVLEGCTWLHPTYCALPQAACMGLTLKVAVNPYNIKQVNRWILNGPKRYPGANSIIMKDGRDIDLSNYDNRRDINLSQVAYVCRHLLEGDWIIVNRSPTLHRGSTMGFRLKVVKNSFVINLHVCTFQQFGADCDGDEMNIHIPQTIEAQSEVCNIMWVKYHTMQDGALWIKFIQNAVIGAFLLTFQDTFLTKDQVCILLGSVPRFHNLGMPAIFKPKPLWTGKQVASCIIPHRTNMINADIYITRGHLVKGTLTEEHLNNILKDIVLYQSLDEAMDFLFEGYLLFQEFINMRGHSCSFHDTYYPNASNWSHYDKLKSVEHESESVVREHIQFYTKYIQDELKEHVIRNDRLSMNHGLYVMIESGAKCSWSTLAQIMGVVGQTYVADERMKICSSHYDASETKSLQAQGFINRPYSLGLTLKDIISQSRNTLENVINKIRGTSKAGYIVRKMATCLMSLTVDTHLNAVDLYNGYHRTSYSPTTHEAAHGPLVWLHYGGDNMDPQYLCWESLQTHTPIDQLWPMEIPQGICKVIDHELQTEWDSWHQESWFLWYKLHRKNSQRNQDFELKFKSPFRILRLFQQIQSEYTRPQITFLHPLEIMRSLDCLWQTMVKDKMVHQQHNKFQLLLRLWCCPVSILQHWFFSSTAWYQLLKLIFEMTRQRNVLRGEPSGMNATQCVGEVNAQRMLKSPHTSAKKGTTSSGCGKLAQLIDANYNVSTMVIIFRYGVSEAEVHYTATLWKTVYLSDVLASYPTMDTDRMVITLHLLPEKCLKLLIHDYHIELAIHQTLKIPFSHITFTDTYTMEIQLSPSVQLWSFALEIARKNKVANTEKAVLHNFIYNLYNQTILRGAAQGITNFLVEKQDVLVLNQDKIEKEERWVVITDHSDFTVWKDEPLVDQLLSYSTHMHDVQRSIGIYAATQLLTDELVAIMGTTTDPRHLELMARYMTMNGVVEGFKKNEAARRIHPLQQAAFEESSKHIKENCDKGRLDPCNSISGAALANKSMNLGTGYNIQMIHQPPPGLDPFGLRNDSITIPKPVIPLPTQYVATPKIDGTRHLLVFTTYHHKIQLFTMDRKQRCTKLSKTPEHLPIGLFAGTVLDGDLVIYDKERKPCFSIYDVYMICGNTCTHLRYDQRWELICQVLQLISKKPETKKEYNTRLSMVPKTIRSSLYPQLHNCLLDPPELPFSLYAKPYFDLQFASLFKVDQYLFPTDGMVLYNTASEARAFKISPDSILKFKPLSHQTIDCTIYPLDHHAKQSPHCDYNIDSFRILYRGAPDISVTMVTVEGFLFSYGQIHFDSLLETLPAVMECKWIPETRMWQAYKVREKKANTWDTITQILNNINEDIQITEFTQ
jgi:DNA-directed RNA polymerase beta' subunit